MAVRRMMARRGKAANIWSDNGTNFVGSERDLREALKGLDNERIVDQLSNERVQWHFNPPSSPYFGGAWERLVQSAKRALKAVVGKKCLPAMTERRKWRKDARNVCEGDLVFVLDENSCRGCWPLGRVLRALPEDDWRVRAAEVRTKTGTYIRPVIKLCLLENAK